ncbi:hypothetical protein [Paenibacillus peoriae]|uniref:hypothetical protein n=1 Tax=Paenibacillus peoriae TaxID=59893 RepID=UPI00096C4808|nr:hypothetical protein [Paenibacillus peoriae]OMF43514.1 hypothetical protein BK135_17830 [Paenibacillus peoriae]
MSHPHKQLHSFVDISNDMKGFEIVSTQFGPDGRVYILLIDKVPERVRGMFTPASLKDRHTYKVLILDNHIEEVCMEGQQFNYHYVQPLKNHLLLVGARCHYYGPGQYDLNGKIIDYEGRTVNELLLGDGIQSVQVTEEGTIWTSYFDEGIFGNYGWNEPVGSSGLVAWNEKGHKIYENQAADIHDCYALNVVSEQEIWFYYYSDFSLGCISGSDRTNITFMNPRISGCSGVATDGYHFLFDGGYGKNGQYVLKKNVKPGSLSKGQNIRFLNDDQRFLQPHEQDFRKNRLLLREGSLLYQVAVEELV